MAIESSYLLSEVRPNWGYPKWYHTLKYGKCLKPEYAGLWFVTIPAGQGNGYGEGDETMWPPKDHTFFVKEGYASRATFEFYRRDIKKWAEVAQKVIVGSWCAKYECLWSERPVFDLRLSGGVEIKFGLCKTQPKVKIDRELWFVSLNMGGGHTFLVDHVCAQPEFIRRMGDDLRGWERLCWCRLQHEVIWEEIGSSDDPTTRMDWALDSPYTPENLQDNFRVLEAIEREREE